MPDLASTSVEVEDLVDSVELLVETVREAQREKATLKAQEKLVAELMDETRALLAVLEAPAGKPAAVGLTDAPRPRTPGLILTHSELLAIQASRKRKGLSQAELARQVGITAPSLCNVEKGRQKPTPELLERIHQALGMEDPS